MTQLFIVVINLIVMIIGGHAWFGLRAYLTTAGSNKINSVSFAIGFGMVGLMASLNMGMTGIATM